MTRHRRISLLLFASLAACGHRLVDFGNAPPTVDSTLPANLAAGVGTDTAVSATFSERMDLSTLTAANFSLSKGAAGGPAVAGTLQYDGTALTFIPAAKLSPGTLYTAAIGVGVKDVPGNALAQPYSWTFTTTAVPDTDTPTVLSTNPLDTATGVAANRQVQATFSEPMDGTTLTSTSFTLKQGTTLIGGLVSYAGTTATLIPSINLLPGTLYTAQITTAAKNVGGNALAQAVIWSFTTTATAVDLDSPLVSSTTPLDAALGVAVNTTVAAVFGEPMDATTLSSTSFTLKQGTAPVAGVVSYSGTTATFTPSSDLAGGTNYTAKITTAARDVDGNALSTDKIWGFTTSGPPTVTSTQPANNASKICPSQAIQATFSKAMDPSTITTSTFTLKNGPTPVPGAVTYNGLTATLKPASDLALNTLYTATISSAAKSVGGDALAADKSWTFTTASAPCQQPVNLRTLSTFAAVAGAGLTNSNSGGQTTINGDVGLYPTATCLGDGSPCTRMDPIINGTLYAADPQGLAKQAKDDLTQAYNDGAGRPPGVIKADLAGLTLAPGVYTSLSSMSIAVGGHLTLDAQGDSNAVWIFQVGSSLTVNNNAQVILVNGAKANNIFWAIFASSTLGTNVSFKGNILAGSSNSLGPGTVVEGRMLCRTGQITLLSNTVTVPLP